MNVASLELCKELYGLSGWYDCSHVWKDGIPQRMYEMHVGDDCLPAYDLGYLLRKLKDCKVCHVGQMNNDYYTAWHIDYEAVHKADTPEDAACKLTIELFKQGILVKEDVNREHS